MISFIVIGRNEGWKLTKCFESIFTTIAYNNLNEYEVIYVDSDSSDDSIERAKKFDKIKIFKITGDVNAAIARNVGAKESEGEILFFIDGDMEISEIFFEKINEKFYTGIVTGYLLEKYCEVDSKIEEIIRKYNIPSLGGIFLVPKEIYFSINGMDERFRKSEDFDFAIRALKNNIKVNIIDQLIAVHNTIPYKKPKRFFWDIYNNNYSYRAVLFRKHILNKYAFKLFLTENYSFIIFILTIIVSYFSLLPFFIYLIVIIYRGNKKKISLINILLFLFRDIKLLVSIVTFFPKNPSYTYNQVN